MKSSKNTVSSLPPAPVKLPREGGLPVSPRARRQAKLLDVPLQPLPLPAPGKRITERDVLAAAAANAKIPATPAARKLAAERGIGLSQAFAQAAAEVTEEQIARLPAVPLRLPAERQPLSPPELRQAEGAAYAQQFIPQFSLEMLVLAPPLTGCVKRLRSELGKTHAPAAEHFVLRAMGLLLARDAFRPFSGVIDGGSVVYRGDAAIGFAVHSEGRSSAPVVLRHAGRLSVEEIARQVRVLSDRARRGKLAECESAGALAGFCSLAEYGVLSHRALLRPGESAALTLPAAHPCGMFDSAWRVTLSADARLIDPPLAAQFLKELCQLAEHPERLLAR